jgi:hypothetical protein
MKVEIALYAGYLIILTVVRTRSLSRNGKTKEASLYGGLMAVCAVLGSLIIAKVDIPSLVVPYQIVFEPIGKMILKE